MNMNFDAAIFDMDGTLLDTMPYWRYTALEYILKHGYPMRFDLLQKMYYEPTAGLLERYSAEEGLVFNRGEVVKELWNFMDHHYVNHVRAKPFACELLEMLRRNGFRMCLATATPLEHALKGLERTGIRDYFEFVTDHYETGLTKSSPEFFINLASRLGVAPERCVVFEDTLYPMKSAKAAGMTVYAVEDATQANDRKEIMATADRYIRDFAELVKK